MDYVRLTHGLNDKGKLVPITNWYEHIQDPNSDYYKSIFTYNDAHFKLFKERDGSVAGIVDVTTKSLIFDFDSETDVEAARADTITLCSRLAGYGVKPDEFIITFSGNKGFSVEIETTSTFNPTEFKNITGALASGLATRDSKIVNPSRIFRIAGTRHPKSGLYKIIISLSQLSELNSDQIKELAKDLNNSAEWEIHQVILPEGITKLGIEKVETVIKPLAELRELDLSLKPKNMPACKYAILNGFFKAGSRHYSLMALAAHFKAQGFEKEVTYRILKGAVELQERRYPTENPVGKEDIWNKIIKDIYSPTWQGKTYGCEHDFLREVCPALGSSKCSHHKKDHVVSISSVSNNFKHYATNIDRNTIKTGIIPLDKYARFQTESHVVIAGSSGSGKTSLVLNILNNVSNQGLKSVFGSMDMGSSLVFQKIAQKVSGFNDDKLYNMYKSNQEAEIKRVEEKISKEYQNVLFDFRSGVSIEELRENLLTLKEKEGDNLKLAVYDFINRIRGPYSDETSNLAYVAPKLADLANEAKVCIISLAQTSRAKGGPSAPLEDSRIAKGSSAIEESATILLGLWRDGYNTENDNFITIAGLKMRMGQEFRLDLHWDGLRSHIRELTGEEEFDLEQFRKAKAEKEPKKSGWDS